MSHGAGLVRTTCSSGGGPGAGAGQPGARPSEGPLDPIYPRTYSALLKVAQMLVRCDMGVAIFVGPNRSSTGNFLQFRLLGHSADRLHLREELGEGQPQRLQLLRSGHHLQLDHDPCLLPGAPLPPLPLAHLHQLAAVGTSALFNRYLAPPNRLHCGSLQELQPERTGRWSDLRVRGHLPLPGEHLDVLQDLLCDPVSRCSCVTPPQARPRGRPCGQEGQGASLHEGLLTLRSCAKAPSTRVGPGGGFGVPPGLLSLAEPLFQSLESSPPRLGRNTSLQGNLVSPSRFENHRLRD